MVVDHPVLFNKTKKHKQVNCTKAYNFSCPKNKKLIYNWFGLIVPRIAQLQRTWRLRGRRWFVCCFRWTGRSLSCFCGCPPSTTDSPCNLSPSHEETTCRPTPLSSCWVPVGPILRFSDKNPSHSKRDIWNFGGKTFFLSNLQTSSKSKDKRGFEMLKKTLVVHSYTCMYNVNKRWYQTKQFLGNLTFRS